MTDIECNEPDSKEIQSIILSLDCKFAHRECPAPPQFLGGLLCLFAGGEGTTHSTCSLAAEIQRLVFLILKKTRDIRLILQSQCNVMKLIPCKLFASSPFVSGS